VIEVVRGCVACSSGDNFTTGESELFKELLLQPVSFLSHSLLYTLLVYFLVLTSGEISVAGRFLPLVSARPAAAAFFNVTLMKVLSSSLHRSAGPH